MIRKDTIIGVKTTLGKLKDGDLVYFREDGRPSGTIHSIISLEVGPGTVRDIHPNPNWRFILMESDERDQTKYTFQPFHCSHTCYRRVRADEIAGLITKEEETL
jgi:hypothetical protein